jgi:ribosomal-protein-alanine N-acetyltransferase
MDNIIIKKAEISHVPMIHKIETECFSSPWSEKSIKDFITNDTAIILIALHDEKFSGYIGMYHSFGEGDITNVAVSTEYRNCGIGQKLIKSLIDYSKENSINILRLEVRESNIAAISLYKKLGFYNVGLRKNYYSHPKENAVLMDLNLDTATEL